MIFGTFIPQGWKMELAGIADPQAKWAKAVEIAVLAEELGYDSLWVYDHFHNVPVPAHETMFECWTTMAALAEATSKIRLGQLVTCALYRNPGYLAKVSACVDVISGGRVDVGLGAGTALRRLGHGRALASGDDLEEVGIDPGFNREPAFAENLDQRGVAHRGLAGRRGVCRSRPRQDATERAVGVRGARAAARRA